MFAIFVAMAGLYRPSVSNVETFNEQKFYMIPSLRSAVGATGFMVEIVRRGRRSRDVKLHRQGEA